MPGIWDKIAICLGISWYAEDSNFSQWLICMACLLFGMPCPVSQGGKNMFDKKQLPMIDIVPSSCTRKRFCQCFHNAENKHWLEITNMKQIPVTISEPFWIIICYRSNFILESFFVVCFAPFHCFCLFVSCCFLTPFQCFYFFLNLFISCCELILMNHTLIDKNETKY